MKSLFDIQKEKGKAGEESFIKFFSTDNRVIDVREDKYF